MSSKAIIPSSFSSCYKMSPSSRNEHHRQEQQLLEKEELQNYYNNPNNKLATAAASNSNNNNNMNNNNTSLADLPELVAEIELNQKNQKLTEMLNAAVSAGQIDPSSIPTVLRRNTSFDTCVLQKNERRVLVIYTGGTIGMVRGDSGALVPLPNMLEKTVRKFPHLHDEKYAKMRFGDSKEQPVVLPEMNAEKTRIIYTIYEYDPLLDSSNMTMDDWIRIAQDVKDNYEKFDAFVILHGTDTMSYTASALSFMMDSLGKSVIITGSQIPLFETRSDGRDNFLGALILAGSYVIPEVTCYFGHRLFRGNRLSKVSSDSLSAFDSPNLQPLATMGINIQVNYHNIFRPTEISPFTLRTSLNRNVGLLRLFPSITLETVRVFLQAPTLGVVLQSYGAGNLPSNRLDLMKEFEDATSRGVLIVNCTQCGHGSVAPIYETGKMTESIGIIPGYDMTPEAALTKLSYVLGRSDWSLEKKREMLQTSLKGELTKLTPGSLHQSQASSSPPAVGLNNNIGSYYNNNSNSNGYPVGVGNKPAEFVVNYAGTGKSNEISIPMGPDVVQNVVRVVSTNLGLNSPEEQMGIKRLLAPSLSCALITQAQYQQQQQPNGSSNSKLLESLFGNSEAEISAGDYSGRTPLHFAASLGNVKIVEYLLKKGASVHIRDNRGFSPLSEAVEFDQHEVIKLLRKCGAHLTLEPKVLGAELNLAVSRGDIAKLKSYLLAGSNLNQDDKCGRYPIHVATEARNVQVVQWLLSDGNINLGARNKLGQTAMDLAVLLRYTEIVQMILSHKNK